MTMPVYKPFINYKELEELKQATIELRNLSNASIILKLIEEIEGLNKYIELLKKKSSSGF